MMRSLKRQISVMFIGLIVFILVMMCLVNGRYLEQYYVKNKTYELKQMYEASAKAVKKGNIDDSDVTDKLNGISDVYKRQE